LKGCWKTHTVVCVSGSWWEADERVENTLPTLLPVAKGGMRLEAGECFPLKNKNIMPVLLNCISYFSLLRGVLSPYEICIKAKQLGYNKIALTDRNNLYGLPEFLKACGRVGIQPIIGAEVTDDNYSVLMYAHGKSGYYNLCRIITEKHCNSNFNIINALQSSNEGLHIASDDIIIIKELYNNMPIYFRIKSLHIPPSYIKENEISSLIMPQSVFASQQQ